MITSSLSVKGLKHGRQKPIDDVGGSIPVHGGLPWNGG